MRELTENREKKFFENKLNWDNEFSARFKMENSKALQYIPNSIFSIELPKISVTDIDEKDVNKYLKITLRSSADGSVESEVFDVLFRNSFDVEISLSNPNVVAWQYNSCAVEDIEFSQLVDRKSKANPFNFTLFIKVSQIVYTGNGKAEPIVFGEKMPDRVAIETETTKTESVNKEA